MALGITFAGAALMLIGSEANAKPAGRLVLPTDRAAAPPNVEINTLYLEATGPKAMSKEKIDDAIARVRKLQAENSLRNPADYTAAAIIVAKGRTASDAAYAHDLALCALAQGDTRAAAWAALTQDQLMIRLNVRQRFGTQAKNGRLMPVSADVADAMRLIVGLPSLLVAKQKAESGQSLSPASLPRVGYPVPVPVQVARAE